MRGTTQRNLPSPKDRARRPINPISWYTWRNPSCSREGGPTGIIFPPKCQDRAKKYKREKRKITNGRCKSKTLMEGIGSDMEREEEETAEADLLRDRFRLSTISIAEAEAKQIDLEIAQPIVACISDLAFKYAEKLAKDLELFAQHAGRKSINIEDVILSAHRNDHLATSLRSFCNNLKAKELQTERKKEKSRKRRTKLQLM